VSDKANITVNPVSPYNNLIGEQIATFVGQYVANKCGKWILDEGGWDEFVQEWSPNQKYYRSELIKWIVLITLGVGALATKLNTR
jgi:hypothetical protein